MAFYFAIAAVAALLMYIAERCEAHRSEVLAIVLYAAVAVLFSHFAGARNIIVGTDTMGYAYNSYQAFNYYGYDYFWNSSEYADFFAPLFKALCVISISITHTFYGYLFAIELLTVIPVILACRKMLGRWAWMGISVFAVVFYPMSFNMMRQMVAMGFLLLAFLAANERRPVRYLVLIVVAYLFHSSSIVGLLFYPLVVFARGKGFKGGLNLVLVCVAGLAFVALAPTLIQMLPGDHYQNYLSGEWAFAGGVRTPVLTAAMALLLGMCGWVFTCRSQLRSEVSNMLTEATVAVAFGIVCLALSLLSFYLYRIGFFFLYISILLIPLLCSSIDDRNSRVAMVALAFICVCMWAFDYYAIQGSHDVVPYLFATISL